MAIICTPKHSSSKDVNQIAASIVGKATDNIPQKETPQKNPAAVALGRLEGLKGGKSQSREAIP